MAILTRDELMLRLKDRFGTSEDAEDIGFIEDISDTYDSLANNEDKKNLEEMTVKYNELQAKYRDRFFQTSEVVVDNEPADKDPDPEPLHYEDLFIEEE